MRLVERTEEMAGISMTFDRCRTGGSEIVVVSGSAASGKTRLLREVSSVVSDTGALVLLATGSAAESVTAYGVIRQLWLDAGIDEEFDACLRDAGPDREARSVHRICSALLDQIGERPALIGIDDVQHADASSRGVLLHLQRRLASRHVLVLLTAGDSAWAAVPSFDAELHRFLPCLRLRLRPLSAAGVADLLGEPAHSPRAAAYHDACGGNPLLLGALIADGEFRKTSAEHGGDPAEPSATVPADELFKAAVSACVHRGDETMLSVARSLAVFARACPPRLLGALLELDAAEIERCVAELTRTGVLCRDGDFRHPGARAALVETTPAEQRAALNARVAELLYQDGADAATIAPHVLLSGDRCAGWAAEIMVAASGEALRAGRSAEAIGYAEFALRAELAPTLRASALVLLVQAKWRTVPSAVVSHLGDLESALHAGCLDHRGVEALLSSLLWTGRFDQALDVAGSSDPLNGARTALGWLRFLNPAALADAETDAPPERHLPDLRQRSLAALLHTIRPDRSGQAVGVDAVLQNCERAEPSVETVFAALLALVLGDELDRAENWCARLAADFRGRGLVTLTAVVTAVEADVALRRGTPSVAARRAGTALDMLSRASWGVAVGYPLGVLITARVELGRLDKAEDLLRHPLPPLLLDSAFGLTYRYARGQHALAGGRPYAAVEDFSHCGRVLAGWGVELSTMAPWRIGLAQAYAALGRADEARVTLADQVRLATGQSAYLGAMALRLLSRLCGADQRLALLQRSVGVLEDSGHRREFALALAQLSNEHYARGDAKRSRVVARRAMEVARTCECEDEARHLLLGGESFDVADLLGENSERYPELTDAEGRVARLAARGLTNRQIGQRLYLSTSTVEQHLTKIFRKFKISRRTDLIGMLRAEQESVLRAS